MLFLQKKREEESPKKAGHIFLTVTHHRAVVYSFFSCFFMFAFHFSLPADIIQESSVKKKHQKVILYSKTGKNESSAADRSFDSGEH